MSSTKDLDELRLMLFALACDIFCDEAEERQYSGDDGRKANRGAGCLPAAGRLR